METKTLTVTTEHLEQARKECHEHPGKLSRHCILAVAAKADLKRDDLEVGTRDIYIGEEGWPNQDEIWNLDLIGQGLISTFDDNWRDPDFKFGDGQFFIVTITKE